MKCNVSPASLGAVLICSDGDVCNRLVASWRYPHVRLVAVVLAGASRRKPLGASLRRAQKAGVMVVVVEYPVDWNALEARLGGVDADVLVCWAFMRLIPASFLARFRHGGVNFHPSLLPAYAGPHPTRCMVADGTYGRYGGLTMHRMTEIFDEGEVLARSKFLPEDYRSAQRFKAVLAAAMGVMIRDVLPLHCAGLLREDEGTDCAGAWAEYHPRCALAGAWWSADDIAAAGAFLDLRKGIRLRLGARAVGGFEMFRKLGKPTGRPPVFGLFTVAFDCADARISMFRTGRAGRLAMRLRNAVLRRLPAPATRPVSFRRVDEGL
jgi:folate-dependent phosphoribosylglycinamide formyltransferase PurN